MRYCCKEDAEEAIRKLHNYEIRPGYYLAVTRSVDNRKLVIKPSPAIEGNVTEEEVRVELEKILEGVVRVRFISSRWLELEFVSHRMAAVARRILVPGNLTMFQNIGITQVRARDDCRLCSVGFSCILFPYQCRWTGPTLTSRDT